MTYMTTRFLVSILVILLGVSFSHAQKFPVPKNPSRIFHLRQPGRISGVSVSPLANSVERAATQAQVAPMSTTALFHRMGNMEFWRPPVSVPPLEVTPRPAFGSAKRSRESLELEATSYGMPDYIAEKMSRDELQEWLGTYLSFRNITKGITSRREQAQNLPVTNFRRRADVVAGNIEELITAQKWAESQPDYFEENYVTDFEQQYGEDYKKFVIPDGAPYKDKPLRILVVDDDHWVYSRMYDSGAAGEWEDESVSLAYLDTSAKAKRLLENYPQRVDVILLDLAQTDSWMYSRLEVPMYVYNHHLNIPVISFSNESCNNGWLLSYNIVGQYPPVITGDGMPELIAYLKNIVYTGRARPQ